MNMCGGYFVSAKFFLLNCLDVLLPPETLCGNVHRSHTPLQPPTHRPLDGRIVSDSHMIKGTFHVNEIFVWSCVFQKERRR